MDDPGALNGASVPPPGNHTEPSPGRLPSWLLTGRLPPLALRFPFIGSVILTAVAVVAWWLSGLRLFPFIVIVSCVLSVHLAGHALLRRGLWPTAINVILRLTNLAGYTLAVILSKYLYSPLIPLYVEDILSASLRHGRRGAWKGWGLVTLALGVVALATSWPIKADTIVRFLVYAAVMGIIAMISGELGQQRIETHATLAQRTRENVRLYAELETHVQRLNAAYEELQELDYQKTAFVQTMSHELRTPLLFIRGYIELMLEGGLGELTPLQREKLQVVAAKTALLADLVRDVISLQRAEDRRDAIKTVSLVELTREAVASAEAAVREQGLKLRVNLPDDDLPVQASARRIVEVFDNLIGNAVKFSPDGGNITVSAWQQDGMAWVSVADEGIGVPPEEHERIFERFYQVDNGTTRRFEGTGLGLAIVKEIAESHGGRIWVESPTLYDGGAHGSTFYFTLPLAAPAQEDHQDRAGAASEANAGT